MSKKYSSDEKNIIGLYAMIGAGSIIMLVPYSVLPIAGFISVLVGWIASFVYRFKHKEDEGYQFHMRFLNKTILLSSLFFAIGCFFFGCIIFYNGDLSAINSLMQGAERGVIPTEGDIARMQYEFVMTNKALISTAAVFTLIPYPVFIIYRMFRGIKQLVQRKEG